jgi:hypothetical protein
VGTAEHTDALTRRIEQLAAAALDEGDGAALAALIAALRSEIGAVRVDVGSLRSETGGLRTDLDGLEERVVASVDAGKRETTSLLRRFAGELDETVSGALDDAAQATAATGSSLEDARGVLESRLAVLEDAVDGLSERLESLARDGAKTTTAKLQELDGTVRELDARLSAQGVQTAEQVVDRLGKLVEARVAATEARLVQALDAAQARAADDRTAVDELAVTTGDRLDALTGVLERTLSALQTTIAEQSAGVAALTDRFAGTGEELVGRVAELSTAVDERTGALRTDLTGRMAELEAAMSAFRTEWPTRTFEVVEGARAVAESITREVRIEVGEQLARVRGELARGVEEAGQARQGLDAQSARLADAGRVLVAYLAQRDRLLESERDRVLHDVLDSFATGLSSRERTALAGRMGDAVARRRDARDAERYRASLTGSPRTAPDRSCPRTWAWTRTTWCVRCPGGDRRGRRRTRRTRRIRRTRRRRRRCRSRCARCTPRPPRAGRWRRRTSTSTPRPPGCAACRSAGSRRRAARWCARGPACPGTSPPARPGRPRPPSRPGRPARRPGRPRLPGPHRAGSRPAAARRRGGAGRAGGRHGRSASPGRPRAWRPTLHHARTARRAGAPLERPAGAPGGTPAAARTARKGTAGASGPEPARTSAPKPARTSAAKSARTPAGSPAGAPGEARGRLSVLPEVPGVDVALDLGDLVPPELVGAVPVVPDGPAVPAVAPQPAAEQPGVDQPGAS